MKKNKLWILLVFCIYPLGFVQAQCTPDSIFAFGRDFELNGEFYRAITEYQRIVFHFPDHPLAAEAGFRIGRTYMKGGKYPEAEKWFEKLVESANWRTVARYARGEARFFSGNSAGAIHDLRILSSDNGSGPAGFSIRYSWIRTVLSGNDLDQAMNLLSDWTGKTPEDEFLADKLGQHLNSMKNLHHRYPVLSGCLSTLIPGAGQVYSGRWRDGLMAFVVNGLFIGAMAAAIENGHEETAWALGFFEAGFFSANIYNAVNDAHKFNRDQWQQHLTILDNQIGRPFRGPAIVYYP